MNVDRAVFAMAGTMVLASLVLGWLVSPYWLLLTARDAIPHPQPLATAEFTTLRMRLLKIGARISETLSRVRIALAAACPEAELFRGLVRSFLPAGP